VDRRAPVPAANGRELLLVAGSKVPSKGEHTACIIGIVESSKALLNHRKIANIDSIEGNNDEE
jgi:hypothetical protein